MTSSDTVADAAAAPAKGRAAADALNRFGGLIVGVVSLVGLIAIGWTLWPTSLGPATKPTPYLEVGGLRGNPVRPPDGGGGWGNRGGSVRVGDVEAQLRNDKVTFRYAGNGGRWDTSPALIGAADAERVEVFTRLRRDAGLRKRLGVTMEQLKPAVDASRGNVLNVPDGPAQAVLAAMKGRDRDAVESAVAAAGNAARADFLARTQTALAALRGVVTDALVVQVREAGQLKEAKPAVATENEPADAKP